MSMPFFGTVLKRHSVNGLGILSKKFPIYRWYVTSNSIFIGAIHFISFEKICISNQGEQIYWNHRYQSVSEITNVFASIDGTDCDISEPTPFTPRWFSHKFRGTGIRCEIGVCLRKGRIFGQWERSRTGLMQI